MCQVLAGANERGYVVPVFRMMQNKRKHLGHLGKTPDCSNVQDARTCMGWTYFPRPLPSSSSSSFSLELYRFHRHTFSFYFLYIQTHLSFFACLSVPSGRAFGTARPTRLPRLTPSPLTTASSVCRMGADRYRICQCYTTVYTFFLAAIVASLQPPMGDELVRTAGAITNERKSDTAWTFPSICIRIPEIFPLFSFFTSIRVLYVWMPAVHGHMCAFTVCAGAAMYSVFV